jgi:hypothetical protein
MGSRAFCKNKFFCFNLVKLVLCDQLRRKSGRNFPDTCFSGIQCTVWRGSVGMYGRVAAGCR